MAAAVTSYGTVSSFVLLQHQSSKSKYSSPSSYSLTTTTKGRKKNDNRFVSLCLSSSSTATSSSSPSASEDPRIELEFLDPKPDSDGTFRKDEAVVKSGEKLLRNIMNDNKIELYAAYGKVMNCGGTGSCGTCIVEIVDGQDLLNERTNTEKRYLKKKPESWRLACQTIVGNKENSGKVIVQRLPQWKK